jgi:GTP-binding protein
VPVGTIVKNIETQDIVADLSFHGQTIAVAKGGRGGLGNMYFKSSTNQAPLYSQDGEEGVELELKLELKLLADMALVGLPNAGKSTLLSTISNAKPKVADYPFTTLKPELGVINHREKTFVMADIPGLIEDASKGKGLGLSFLKHIERTKVLVHLIDCSMFLDEFEALDSYSTIRNELEEFGRKLEDKREIVCLTKTDAMTEDEISRFQAFLADSLCKKVLPISTVSGKNMEFFKDILVTALEDLPQ